ncbi:MAG: hypothetical protein KDK53_20545 [Maritimibacter sp.]|nr:hypothetical protein [Maritimibacter sp.]
MFRPSTPVLPILLTLAALTAAPATAGQWTRLAAADEFEDCAFAFTGPINPGDLTGILTDPAWNDAFRKRVCLDSPGGSLKEVYDFITAEGDEGLGFATTVKSDARCESACAILFMFGQSWGANSPYPDRMLEPGAKLGFHSPFLAGADIAEDQREDVFRVALDVAKLLMDTSYKATTQAGAPLPYELVSLVLSTPGDQMHYVETLGELKLLGIERPYDTEARVRIGADRASIAALVERVCVSSYAMTFRNWLVDDGYDFNDLVAYVRETLASGGTNVENLVELPASDYQDPRIVGILSGPFHVPGWYSAGAALYCRAELSVAPGAGVYDVSVNNFNVSFGPLFDLDETPLPEWNGEYNVISAGVEPIDTPF